MMGAKFTSIVALMTATTVVLQVMLLYTSNHCYFSSSTEPVDVQLERINLEYHFPPNQSITGVTRKQTVGPSTNTVGPVAIEPVVKRRLTIGIPTTKRQDGNYFMEMLGSMLNKTSEKELAEIVFVIYLADLNDTAWKSETEAEIEARYSNHLKSGSLKVIQAPKEFYKGLLQYGNDSYLNWRTKQNYDYAFLMRYCEHLSDYYMQMEDDVIASDGYYSAITDFVAKQPNDSWVCLEFSELGFIGKLYHSRHLRDLATMLIIFSNTQPVDYLFAYFNMLRQNGDRKMRKPTLFQHMGYHSSLNEKIQPLRDKYFDFPTKVWNGDNPSAKIFTTLVSNSEFPPNLPYSSAPGHFWSSSNAKENDTYTIVFDSSQLIDKIVVETGSKEHPSDVIHNGVVEASAVVSGPEDKPICEDTIPLANLEDGKVVINTPLIKAKLGVVRTKCLQIRLTKGQVEWVIIKEIGVFLSKT